MKLLDVVNNILSDMNSFPVASISHDVEGEQVANIVKNTYEYLTTIRKWPATRKRIRLESSGELDRPNEMVIPDNIIQIDKIMYAVGQGGDLEYKTVELVTPDEFLAIVNNRNANTDNVVQVENSEGIPLNIKNDTHPTYYTSFDDKTLVFDSWNKNEDDTLKSSRSVAVVYQYPVFIMSDTFDIDIPAPALQLLISEAKSHSFLVLKQMPNNKEEMRARKLSAHLSHEKNRSGLQTYRYPNYGRK